MHQIPGTEEKVSNNQWGSVNSWLWPRALESNKDKMWWLKTAADSDTPPTERWSLCPFPWVWLDSDSAGEMPSQASGSFHWLPQNSLRALSCHVKVQLLWDSCAGEIDLRDAWNLFWQGLLKMAEGRVHLLSLSKVWNMLSFSRVLQTEASTDVYS